MLNRLAIIFLILSSFHLSGCTYYVGVFPLGYTVSHATKAEMLREEKQYEEAIKQYHLHMEERLANPERPPSENPYFYNLLIGDMYLEMDKPDAALAAYETAHEKEVTRSLVVDRMRKIARIYEENEDFENAISLLNEYRELDEELFDNDIDRIHKKSVRKEQTQRATQ